MGLFSKIFSKATSSWSRSISLSSLYAASAGKASQGIALDRFQAVVDAHSDIEGIVEEFDLSGQECHYQSLDGYPNCYEQAYTELYEKAVAEAEMIEALTGEPVDPEELIDEEEVEENAYEYACELAEAWYGGDEFIPPEVLDWAWYDLSSHNS